MSTPKANAWWRHALAPVTAGATPRILACDSTTATLRLVRPGRTSVLKAGRLGSDKLAALRTHWDILSLFGPDPDFPGPRPLARHVLPDIGEAFELTYLAGSHPRFGSDSDFLLFGATIARLHRISRGRNIPGIPTWDADRFAHHFDDARLLRFFSNSALAITHAALDLFVPRYAVYLAAGTWTGVVHSDCHRHNVLIDNGCGSLIDFGEAGFGVLFWDLGVAVADSAVDAPGRAAECRQNLLEGYVSVLPEAASVLTRDLPVFEGMRALEVMTWPVSDWAPERLEEGEDEARGNIEASVAHLDVLLSQA